MNKLKLAIDEIKTGVVSTLLLTGALVFGSAIIVNFVGAIALLTSVLTEPEDKQKTVEENTLQKIELSKILLRKEVLSQLSAEFQNEAKYDVSNDNGTYTITVDCPNKSKSMPKV